VEVGRLDGPRRRRQDDRRRPDRSGVSGGYVGRVGGCCEGRQLILVGRDDVALLLGAATSSAREPTLQLTHSADAGARRAQTMSTVEHHRHRLSLSLSLSLSFSFGHFPGGPGLSHTRMSHILDAATAKPTVFSQFAYVQETGVEKHVKTSCAGVAAICPRPSPPSVGVEAPRSAEPAAT